MEYPGSLQKLKLKIFDLKAALLHQALAGHSRVVIAAPPDSLTEETDWQINSYAAILWTHFTHTIPYKHTQSNSDAGKFIMKLVQLIDSSLLCNVVSTIQVL